MRTFEEIRTIAAARKGGDAALEALMSPPLTAQAVAAQPDDRWLSAMARAIFQAGFSWKVIATKWPGFEVAFEGFDPGRILFYHDEEMDRLISDRGIVRNGPKIAAVIDNARFVADLSTEHGSAGAFFANWPNAEFVDLLELMKKRGSRLGGNTGQRLLRGMGRDGFMLSGDVVARLISEGVVTKQPSSKRDMAAVQDAFNGWADQSGRSLTEISRTLAFSVGS